MTDQTKWGIPEVQSRNKAKTKQKNLISQIITDVDKLEEESIIDLIEKIEAIYERKYGENKANKLVL